MPVHNRFGCLALALLVVAGCSRAPQDAGAMAAATAKAATPPAASIAGASPGHTFATLPDRGELLAYASNDVEHDSNDVRHDGAYTWHRANLSEAYALRAIADGHLRLTTPSGQSLDIQYDDHVEHDSGDWTWVGHAPGHPEQQTILTFGPHAAFGTIAQPDGPPLRLTVRNGASWIVETDPTKVAALHNAATDPKRPDFHVPPKATPGATTGGMRMSSAPARVAAAASTTTVDVVLGYSPGFAADHGGASGAVTRLNYLVDVANTAYGNSAINAKVRLVHAMQVTYTDSSSNDSTLEKLTGYDSTNNRQTTPDPAFNALRAAREQYGADLVSMVRSYRDPENDGCGIAWLIGGGQSGIATSDSYFGYSVVSDGTDQGTDGKTYYCLDETLAHEMGHNMGAAHDVETAKGGDGKLDPNDYGAYSYSFGYKTTATTGNFYTIMAYGDSGQHIYRIFSDPRSTFCGGRACGNANNADNARTLSQTIPTIATFRSSVISLHTDGDFNGDGKADILWRNRVSGANVIWKSANSATSQSMASASTSWGVAGIGDFDADGVSDVLWRNRNGSNAIWRSGNSAAAMAVSSVSDTNWIVAGVGDFNADGRADILWRNRSTGANRIWRSASSATQQSVTAASSAWDVAGIGDFDADGRSDILWRNRVDGANAIWKAASSASPQSVTSANGAWAVAAVADFNGDGHADILWRNSQTGGNTIWKSASSATPQLVTTAALQWSVASVRDYDGDGHADILWRRTSTGANVIWKAANSATAQAVSTAATDWTAAR